MRRVLVDDLVHYRNKITNEIVYTEKEPKTYWIDGHRFVEIVDSKNRKLKIRDDILVRVA